MSDPTIVCLIATWRDEELLAEAVASAAPHVDATIVLDGAYDFGDAFECEPPWWSTKAELKAAAEAGALVVPSPAGWWPGEIEKRNVLLELGRAYLPDPTNRWALILDADELLVNGDLLRELLAAMGPSWLAVPLLRIEPNGQASSAPSRLFRLYDHLRYRGRSYWLNGHTSYAGSPEFDLDLSHEAVSDDVRGSWAAPMVRHQWDRRSPERREWQRRWGRELSLRDHGAP